MPGCGFECLEYGFGCLESKSWLAGSGRIWQDLARSGTICIPAGGVGEGSPSPSALRAKSLFSHARRLEESADLYLIIYFLGDSQARSSAWASRRRRRARARRARACGGLPFLVRSRVYLFVCVFLFLMFSCF